MLPIIEKNSILKKTKIYWLSTGSIKGGEEILLYFKVIHDWLPSVNGEFFARDFANIDKEITLGHLTLIIEFTSKEDAFSAYKSEEYQKMIPLRTPYFDINSYYL